MPNQPSNRSSPPLQDLLECLREWPVSHALLRAIECRKIRRYPLERPILEVGSGDGYLSALLFETPLEAGIDLRHTAAARARARGRYHQALVADAASLPFSDASFASVFSNCVLEHVDRLPGALGEIARVLRPQGTLLATVPTPRWESQGPFPLLRRAGFHGLSRRLNDLLQVLWHHVTLEEREGWHARLERAGLDLRIWDPYMGPHAYALYARRLAGSSAAFFAEKVPGLRTGVRAARRLSAVARARALRETYLAPDVPGTCALMLAVRS